MEFNQQVANSANVITAYDGQSIKINTQRFTSSIILSSAGVAPWNIHHVDELNEEHFSLLAGHDCPVVILGTGKQQVFPQTSITRPLIDKGIGLEVMDSQAACRTYNILLADSRPALAAIIL